MRVKNEWFVLEYEELAISTVLNTNLWEKIIHRYEELSILIDKAQIV